MNRKQVLVLVAVLAVLVAAGGGVMWWQQADWRTTDSSVGQRLVPGLVIANVATMEIREPGTSVTLLRKEDGWHVRERKEYPANIERIGDLLIKLSELKIVQTEPMAESQRSRLQLVDPKDAASKDAGTWIVLKDKDGNALAQLLLGKKVVGRRDTTAPTKAAPEPTGRYVLGNKPGSVVLVSDTLSQVEAKPGPWLARDLIRVRNANAMSLSSGDGKPLWTVTRQSESADWKFADSSEKLDSNKAQDLVSVLFYIALKDVSVDDTKAGFDQGRILKVQTTDNLTYTLRLGNLEDGLRYLKISLTGEPPKARVPGKNESKEEREKKDKEFEENHKGLLGQIEREQKLEGWTYLVDNTDVAALLRGRAEFRPEKKKDEKKKS